MENFKINFKSLIKDWKFWYKLVFMLLMLATMITSFTESLLAVKDTSAFEIYNSENILIGHDYMAWFINWSTYFTNQTNLAILFWFIIALIEHKKEGSTLFTKYGVSVGFATYITVTFLTYNLMLMPTSIESLKHFTSIQWFINVMTHMLGPIIAVVYMVGFANKQNLVDTKTFAKKYSWKYIIYPIVYCIITLIFAGVFLASGRGENYPIAPYFFLEIWNADAMAGIAGWIWFIAAVLLISSICIGGSILFNKIALVIDSKQNKK